MKKLLFILLFLICFVSAFAQTKYPLPYDTVIVMKPTGTGYLKAAKGNFQDSLWHRITLALNDSSKLAATTEWVKRQLYGAGGGTPSLPNRSVQLNQNGSFHGSDSMLYNNGALILKHKDSIGLFFSYNWATNPLSTFVDNTGTATVTTDGVKTNINGGAYNFSNSLNLNFYTGIDNYTYHIARIVPHTKNNTSIGLGIFISATTGMGAGTLFNTFLSDTAQYIAYSPGQSLTDGNSINNKSYTTFQFSAFDTLDIYLTKNQRSQTCTVINEANGSQMFLTVNNVIPTVGQPAIFTYGGNYDFLGSYTLTYNDVHNPLLAEMTNSIGWGANSSTILNNYFGILCSRYRTYGVKNSAPTESSLSGTFRVADVLAENPHVLLWAYGVGDFGTSVPLDSFSARIIRTIVPLKAAGIQIIFVNCVPNNGGSVVPYNDTIAAIGSRYNIPVADIYTALLGTGTSINSKYFYDGTHPNTAGHLVAANVIDGVLQNYIIPEYSPLIAQLPPSSDITLPLVALDNENNLVVVQRVPDTTNILNTSTVSSQTIQTANYNISGIGAMNSIIVTGAGNLTSPYFHITSSGIVTINPFSVNGGGFSTLPGGVTQQDGGFLWLTSGAYIEGLTQPVKLQVRNALTANKAVEITNRDESTPISPTFKWLNIYSQVAAINDTLFWINRGGGARADTTSGYTHNINGLITGLDWITKDYADSVYGGGAGAFWALTGTSALTGNTTIDVNTRGLHFTTTNSAVDIRDNLFSVEMTDGLGADAAFSVDPSAGITTSLSSGLVFVGGATDSSNYAGESYVQKDWVLNHIANAGSGANTALSNLASVAINASLVPGSDNTIALGSTTLRYTNLHLASGAFINWQNGQSTIESSSSSPIDAHPADGGFRVFKAGQQAYVYIINSAISDGLKFLSAGIHSNPTMNTYSNAGVIEIATNAVERVGIGDTPNASAKLDVISTTGGFGVPSMTATQASAISSPRDGLLIYVSSTNGTFTAIGFWGRVSSTWTQL